MNSSKQIQLTKVKIAVLRVVCPSFKNFENQYKAAEDNPEAFFRDGERVFTKKEKVFLRLLRGY